MIRKERMEQFEEDGTEIQSEKSINSSGIVNAVFQVSPLETLSTMAPPYYSGALDHPTSSLRGSPSPPSNHSQVRSFAKSDIGRADTTPVYPSHPHQIPSRSSQNETEISLSGRPAGRSKRRAQGNDNHQDEERNGEQKDDDSDGEDTEEEEEEFNEDDEESEQQQAGSPSHRYFSQKDASTNETSSQRSTDPEHHKRPRLLPSLASSFTNNSLPPLAYPNMNGEYHTHSYPSSAHSPNLGQHIPPRSSPSNLPANPDRQRPQHQHQPRSHHASDQSDKPPVSPVVLGFQLTGTDPNTRDSILSALKLKEQQQALIQQRKGTPKNEKEYKKRGPGSNSTASSKARAKTKRAEENPSAESMMNTAEEDKVPSDVVHSASRNVSSSGPSSGSTTAAAGGGPDLPPIIRPVSTSNLLPPPSTFVAYSQSPPRPNPNSNSSSNLTSQLPSIDYHSHPHLHLHHPTSQDKADESLVKRSDGREIRREESERGSSGGSAGRTALSSSESAHVYPSEDGGPGGETAGGNTFRTSSYPPHMTAPSHHHHHHYTFQQQQQQPPQQQLHQYSTLPPPPPPHHTYPSQPAHLPNGRASSTGSHQRPSISVQQGTESVSRSGPQGGYGTNSGGNGGQTAPSPSYLQTSFSSNSSSSSSGRAPPPAPLSIHSSHHYPSSSHQQHQQHQQHHQQGSSHPSPVPYGYSTSGVNSTPSAATSTAPPKATFLAPFERFYDALVDSRTLQSTMTELTTRSAEMNRRADETIHRVEDHHRRCVSVLNTLQASSTSLQDMVRKEVYVVREELSRELDSVWRRVHLLEAALKTAGMDVPGGVSSGSIITEKELERDKQENEEARESSTRRRRRRRESKHGGAPAARIDGGEGDGLESETEGNGDLSNVDQNDQKVEAEDKEDADDGQDEEEQGGRGQKDDEDVDMGGRDEADDDDDEEDTAQAQAFTTVPPREPKIIRG